MYRLLLPERLRAFGRDCIISSIRCVGREIFNTITRLGPAAGYAIGFASACIAYNYFGINNIVNRAGNFMPQNNEYVQK